tara:strand:+ start:236 stop:481 length:246 start_codon:yes stop_codon:yes gene_type:complete
MQVILSPFDENASYMILQMGEIAIHPSCIDDTPSIYAPLYGYPYKLPIISGDPKEHAWINFSIEKKRKKNYENKCLLNAIA